MSCNAAPQLYLWVKLVQSRTRLGRAIRTPPDDVMHPNPEMLVADSTSGSHARLTIQNRSRVTVEMSHISPPTTDRPPLALSGLRMPAAIPGLDHRFQRRGDILHRPPELVEPYNEGTSLLSE